MTEDDWLTKDNPRAMVESVRGRATTRQLRFFGAACCRQVWDLLSDDRLKAAVACVEGYAAGVATRRDLDAGLTQVQSAMRDLTPRLQAAARTREAGRPPAAAGAREEYLAAERAARVVAAVHLVVLSTALERDPTDQVLRAFDQVVRARADGRATPDPDPRVLADLAAVVRCIFGNPFRSIIFDPSWRSEAAVGLARGILADQAYDRCPVLADALEDAGCADAGVLSHLREAGVHVRGCHVVDAVLWMPF